MKLVPGVGFEPTLAYVHISVKQMTLNLNVLKLQTLFVLMSHDLVHYLTWVGRFFYSRGVSEDGSHLGARLGGNLQDGPVAQLAVGADYWPVSAGIIDQSLSIPLHMAASCGLGFSQHGGHSKRKEAGAARPLRTWTQKLQNVAFTVSSYSKQTQGHPQSMGKGHKLCFSTRG